MKIIQALREAMAGTLAAGEDRADPEGVRGRPDIGHSDGSRQDRADGGEDVA